MPIQDPVTGETHYIDVSKVDKLVLEPIKVMDMKTQEIEQLRLQLHNTENEIYLTGTLFNKYCATIMIPVEILEQVLYDIVNSAEYISLEDEPRFSEYITRVYQEIAKQYYEHKIYPLQKKSVESSGLGFVIDSRTKTEVGTFESIEIMPRSEATVTYWLKDVLILPSYTEQFTQNTKDYFYMYYDAKANQIYTIDSFEYVDAEMTDTGFQNVVMIKDGNMSLEEFSSTHFRYSMITQAVEDKSLLNVIDKDSSDFEDQFREFCEKRFSILQEAKQQAKKEKIYHQFADIELEI
jgi:hypothetical protein